MAELPGFDDRLDRALRAQAARAGESIDVYVQRAVAARLRNDLESSGDLEHAALLDLLSRIVDDPATATVSSLHPVLDDPVRLQALRDTGLLDSDADPSYDQIVSMAVEALGVSAAAISLVDDHRQFFKSVSGLPEGVRETPMARSVCRYAVATGEPLVVEDARTHPVLHDHPAVTDGTLVSYAGIPLIDPAGLAIGTLCVWDDKPHQWSTSHVQILDDLAHIVSERVFSTK
jgi:GAF domain-containing protein